MQNTDISQLASFCIIAQKLQSTVCAYKLNHMSHAIFHQKTKHVPNCCVAETI